MTVIRWEDPPAHGNTGRRAKHAPIADALRARPGQWALVSEDRSPGSSAGLAHAIRQGRGAFKPLGHFDAKCVGPAGGSSSKVYARYVGDGGAS